VAGAILESEFRRVLCVVGFGDIDVEVSRVYVARQIAASADRVRQLVAALEPG
jgi:hypothetical protein